MFPVIEFTQNTYKSAPESTVTVVTELTISSLCRFARLTNRRIGENRRTLVHRNSCTRCSIQESPEVKERQLVLPVLSDMCCECRNRTRILFLQLRKSVQITLRCGVIIFFVAERFEGTHGFSSASEHKIANRPSAKILHAIRESRAYTYARAKLFVDRFESRCNIDGIAICSVVEKATTPEISDNCGTGVNADAGYPQRHA